MKQYGMLNETVGYFPKALIPYPFLSLHPKQSSHGDPFD